jgi:hypothetical protein
MPTIIASASTVCQGTDVVFRVSSPVTGATYTWSVNPESPAGTVSTTLGGRSYTVSGASTGTKSVTAYASLTSSGTTCVSAVSDPMSAVVATMPAMPEITASASTVCQYTDLVFEVDSPESGATYVWTGTAGTMSGAGSYIFTVSGATTGTKSKSVYASLASSGTVCRTANAATVTAVVATMPAASVTRISAATVCQGTNVVFRVSSAVTGATYTWAVNPASPAGTVSSTLGGRSYTVSSAETGTKSVSVYASLASSGTTCQSNTSDPVSAVVATMPDTPTIIASASTVCQNTNVVFEVQSPESGATYTWTGTSGTASGAGNYIYTVSGATTGTKSKSAYARLASSGTTCQSANAATVTAVVITSPTITLRAGSPTQTKVRSVPITIMTYTYTVGAAFNMSGDFPPGVSGTSSSSYVISGKPTALGTYGFLLTVTAANGCAAAAAGTITVIELQKTPCTQCCWNGDSNTWVNCDVTTYRYPFDNVPSTYTYDTYVRWSGNQDTFYEGASGTLTHYSDRDGRVNTANISSSTVTGVVETNAVQICKDLGPGWYLPAYEELVNMSAGTHTDYPPLNGLAGANLLEEASFWSSTEYSGNGGRKRGPSQDYAVYVNGRNGGNVGATSKTDIALARCAWRP